MSLLLSNQNRSSQCSFRILILLVCIISFLRISDSRWTHEGNSGDTQLSFDVFGYYLYLPSAFIYHDFSKLEFLREILPVYKPTTDFSQATEGPIGKYVNKYTMGQSVMFAPFFIVTHHIIVPFTDYKRDGFSPPYQVSIALGCLVYTIIGLIFLRKSLKLFFEDRITTLVMILIVLATNYLLYATRENTMPHNQLFAVFAVIIYLSSNFYQNPSYLKAILIGSLIGLCGLIRPTEVIIGIIPVLWGINSFSDLTQRIKTSWKLIGTMVICSFVVFAFQLIYWKVQSGRWLFYSYVNESLNFMNPHFWDVLISYRKGLLVYTPLFLFIIVGIVLMYKQMKSYFMAVACFALINLYIVCSWDCWWYGGSFGQRSMVQFYAIAAFPLGASLNFIFHHQLRWMKGLLGSVLVFILVLNLFQIWQYKRGIIHFESMTKEAYYAVFGKFKSPENLNSLLKEPDYSHYRPARNVTYVEHVLVDENYNSGYLTGSGYNNSGGFKSDMNVQFSPGYTFPIKSLQYSPEVEVKCTFLGFASKTIVDSKLIMTVGSEGKPAYIYKSLDLSLLKFDNKDWHPVEMWLDVPMYVGKEDVIKVYIWNQHDEGLFIDNFQILIRKKHYLD